MLNPVWYYKPTGQWKDEIEKFQGICLYRSLGVLKSVPTRTMQRNAEILPVSIRREKKTRDRFAIRAIRDGSPRNPGTSPTAAKQQSVTLKDFFLESSK